MAELVRRQPWASGVEGGGDKATNDKDAKEHRNEQDAVVDGDDPNAKARRERHSVFEYVFIEYFFFAGGGKPLVQIGAHDA
jgi:hypothetical protein